MKIGYLSLAVASTLLCGCVTTSQMNAKMKSWEGNNVNDLIASWGPPSSTMSDGNGGQILIYDHSGEMVLPGSSTTTSTYNGYGSARYNQYGNYGTANANVYGTGNSTTTYRPATRVPISRNRMFWVNRSGTIYRWSWKGL